MINIAICDDNTVFLQIITKFVNENFTKNVIPHTTFTYQDGREFLKDHDINRFDVVFLDIAMPVINGFEIAKKLRNISEKTYIIFITTESEMVYDSFDFRPFNFITKDSPDGLEARIDHVIKKLAQHISANIPVQIDLPFGEKKFVDSASVIYAKSCTNYVDFMMKDGETVRARGSLEAILATLPPLYFARIHNRYIINMRHVKRFDCPNSCAYMDNGVTIEISRTYKKDFKTAYGLFLRDFS
ncbi:MAG: LytTR family DNA-binding domain-containing protein [Oscillospiraceae bacterium]